MKTTLTGRLITPSDLQGPVYLIGRQPIFDRNQNVFAYELLYRPSRENYVNVMDGDEATLNIILNTFSRAGLNTLVGSKIALINLTKNFLLGQIPITFPPGRIVLEILEDVVVDAKLMMSLIRLSKQGYRFALDDVASFDARADRLAQFATFAKIDVAMVDREFMPGIVQQFKERNITLVAEKVETRAEYDACLGMGFQYFQGFFFCRPEVMPFRKIETSNLAILHVIAKLNQPDVQLDEIENLISIDATLSYRMLKLVNSGYYSFPVKVTSIRQAIMLIGLHELRNWLCLFMMSQFSNKPSEISNLSLLRARTAQQIAEYIGFQNPDSYFLAGLLSLLDVLLDIPMNEIMIGINLAEEISAALVERKGLIGEALRVVEGLEAGNLNAVLLAGIEINTINEIYLSAIQWTEALLAELPQD